MTDQSVALIGIRQGALIDFVNESNRIEGIKRDPLEEEVTAHEEFLAKEVLDVGDLQHLVRQLAMAPLREQVGMDVRVGRHLPPRGGPDIREQLAALLTLIQTGRLAAYAAHHLYERLHPFMDGNGRSGRALWAWQTYREGNDPFALPFLHRWYYQSLDEGRK